MIGSLMLTYALAQAAQPAPAAGSVEVGVSVTFADGTNQTISSVPGNRLTHITSNGSLCADPKVASASPGSRSFGWRIELQPAAGDTRINWRRLEKAAEARGEKNGVRTLPTAARGEWTALDHLDIPGVAGCKVLHWSLVARRTPFKIQADHQARSPLFEAELWFVHKAPDGKETTQRQVIRLRGGTPTTAGGRGEFYFDDMVISASIADRTEPVTVEVFGSLMPFPMETEQDVSVGLQLTRRYINPKAIALGIPPTVGKGDHFLRVAAGEVVSFVLPPLENDRGAFLGHRFSVRLRIKPLGEGELAARQ